MPGRNATGKGVDASRLARPDRSVRGWEIRRASESGAPGHPISEARRISRMTGGSGVWRGRRGASMNGSLSSSYLLDMCSDGRLRQRVSLAHCDSFTGLLCTSQLPSAGNSDLGMHVRDLDALAYAAEDRDAADLMVGLPGAASPLYAAKVHLQRLAASDAYAARERSNVRAAALMLPLEQDVGEIEHGVGSGNSASKGKWRIEDEESLLFDMLRRRALLSPVAVPEEINSHGAGPYIGSPSGCGGKVILVERNVEDMHRVKAMASRDEAAAYLELLAEHDRSLLDTVELIKKRGAAERRQRLSRSENGAMFLWTRILGAAFGAFVNRIIANREQHRPASTSTHNTRKYHAEAPMLAFYGEENVERGGAGGLAAAEQRPIADILSAALNSAADKLEALAPPGAPRMCASFLLRRCSEHAITLARWSPCSDASSAAGWIKNELGASLCDRNIA
jgi:hypothetical protein